MKIVAVVVALVLAVAACNRIVELYPSSDANPAILDSQGIPDAHVLPDAHVGSDGGLPDAITFDAGFPDAS